MIAGLESIDGGEIRIGGKRCNEIAAQYRRVAMVFQSYALFPHMSVYENIRFGLKIGKMAEERIREKIAWATDLFGLSGLERRLPKEISGGQRQRVALARALVLDPEVLLLDEPLSNLDTALREAAMEELKRIHRQVGKTIVYVSHNQTEAMTLSQRIAILNAGRLEQCDTPQTVYDFPRTLFSATFIGSPTMNFFQGRIARRGDTLGVETPIGYLKIDETVTHRGLAEGRELIAGIRPHNISCREDRGARRYSDSMVSVRVELVQSMGDRSLVVGRGENDAVVRFLCTADDEVKQDQNVSIFIDGRRIHLFDPAEKTNILV
jgi:ABC-type sugar transport system ATPase subunit